MQGVRFAIEVVYLSVFDTVGGTADGLAEIRGIV